MYTLFYMLQCTVAMYKRLCKASHARGPGVCMYVYRGPAGRHGPLMTRDPST